MTSPAGKPATIAQKARRKISLPWFRQGSATPPHATLSRQHTIDTPSSFQARLLRRQPSLTQTGVVEMTWVVADHMAAPGSRELSVTKGQQVEVLENGNSAGTTPAGVPNTGEWTLVRLPLTPGQAEPPMEGLVPTSALKQPPTASCKTSPSRKASTQQQQQSHQYHHHQQQQQQQQQHQSMQEEETRPHYVQPRSVRSVPEEVFLHRREKRVRRCACDCAC